MKRITFLTLALIIGSLALSSCSRRTMDFTLLSTKNFNYDKNYKVTKARNTGEFRVNIIVVFPTGNVRTDESLKEAIDNAIEATPGAVALTNVVITYGRWYIPLIYGQEFVEVKGDAVVDVTAKVSDNGNGYFYGEYDENENLIDFKTIDENEYIKLQD